MQRLIITALFCLICQICVLASDSKIIGDILKAEFPANINIIKTPRGIIASFPDDMIFCSDSLSLSPSGKIMLSRISNILKQIENECTIEGHSKEFGKLESFEVSMIKADIVSEYVINNNPKLHGKVFSVGLGDFDPQNKAISGNKQFTERIDIIFFAYDFTR